MATLMSCPHCAKRVDSSLENCPYCGGFLHVGKPDRPAAAARNRTDNCPNCGAVVQPGDIICVACGTNLLTGQKILTETTGTKSKSRTGSRSHTRTPMEINWALVGGVAAALIVVALVGVAAFSFTRDPVSQATALARQGRISEATDTLSRYTQQNPTDPRGFFELGKLHWRSRQFSMAAQAFGEAARLEPRNREATFLAVLANASTQSLSARPSEAALLESYLNEVPTDGEAWLLLALARGTLGDDQGRAEALAQARALGATAATVQQATGVAAALAGDFPDADRALRAALQEAPGNADLRAAAGFVAALQGDNDTAEAQLTEALQGDTSLEKEAALQLGLLHLRAGRFDQASRQFQEVIRLDNNHDGAKFYQAIARQGMGLRPEALGTFETLMRTDRSPYAGPSALRAAALYLAEGDTDRALDAVERAARAGTTGAEYHTTRGRVLARMQRTSEAQDAFRAAVQADSDYAPAHLETGLLYVRRNMMPEGIRALERYVETIDPTLPDARVEEVQALIDQLQRSVQETAPGRTARRAAR